MKKKVLIIFKYPHEWNFEVIKKFSNYYDVEEFYLNNLKNETFIEIIDKINKVIKINNIEITVFDVDYYKFINFFFIEKINSKKKILITQDDFELHELNSITASACDLVLSACPLSVLKYKEKGYKAYVFPPEDLKTNTNKQSKKIHDVIFFGHLTPDRKNFLDHILQEGIQLKTIGYQIGDTRLLRDDLIKHIQQSKIVLNLSKSRGTKSVRNYSSENTYKFYYQFKGRVWDAGLNEVLCVSEYSPGQELFFDENEIPTFYTKEHCAEILKKLLDNNELREEYRKKFVLKIQNLSKKYNNFKTIYEAIEISEHKRVELVKIPYWYLRISAKQILLRNIRLSNLIKSIFQFNVIYKMTKKTNLIAKFLILIESALNILWYSLSTALKPNK